MRRILSVFWGLGEVLERCKEGSKATQKVWLWLDPPPPPHQNLQTNKQTHTDTQTDRQTVVVKHIRGGLFGFLEE